MMALEFASRLRRIRQARGLGQDRVADALGVSVSAVSRLERGVRGLRVEQLVDWAAALGLRVQLLFWEPAHEEDAELSLDEECQAVLRQVAAALPHMPSPARRAMVHECVLWCEAAGRRAAEIQGDPDALGS